jgi:hypothetical protein
MTLEMPYKDNLALTTAESKEWNMIEQCHQLGASVLAPLLHVAPFLLAFRTNNDLSWMYRLSPEDAYIEPTDEYRAHFQSVSPDTVVSGDSKDSDSEDQSHQFQMLSKRYYSDVRAVTAGVAKS